MINEELSELRKTLHRYPELSGKEHNTAKRIHTYLARTNPDAVVTGIGGTGLAAIYDSGKAGPSVLFRSELDALPIQEINEIPYKSTSEGVAHKCGHDGHMTMIAGLAEYIGKNRPEKGRAVILYQPAEETGEGAQWVVSDPKFQQIEPDYVFALHNLPGYEKNTIVVRDDTFASASKGMIAKLQGKTAHAGEPENGINPALAVSEIIAALNKLSFNKKLFQSLTFLTFINIKLGERAFGTSAGYAEVMTTLRSYSNDDMEQLSEKAENVIRKIAEKERLSPSFEWVEEFLAVVNDKQCNDLIKRTAKSLDKKIMTREEPFRWSEDFSHFTNQYKGALFGLGSGLKQPQLHNPDYDFPEDIIETGVNMFSGIYNELLRKTA
ncbi:MAG: amidohydrolase [Bacteroidales bacterium]|nr:amidohydrolase [Bacteroidales bacterium]